MSFDRFFVLFAPAVLLAGPAPAQEAPGQGAASQQAGAPMEVTSDTPEYCSTLADRLRHMVHFAVVPPPKEVADLSSEGQRMCAHGQTRGGIMRLRMALTLMMRDRPSPR